MGQASQQEILTFSLYPLPARKNTTGMTRRVFKSDKNFVLYIWWPALPPLRGQIKNYFAFTYQVYIDNDKLRRLIYLFTAGSWEPGSTLRVWNSLLILTPLGKNAEMTQASQKPQRKIWDLNPRTPRDWDVLLLSGWRFIWEVKDMDMATYSPLEDDLRGWDVSLPCSRWK